MLVNLLDVTECGAELVVFGRLPTGETAALFIDEQEHYVYLAVRRGWEHDGDLVAELNAHLLRRRGFCSRTLCACRRCRACGEE